MGSDFLLKEDDELEKKFQRLWKRTIVEDGRWLKAKKKNCSDGSSVDDSS